MRGQIMKAICEFDLNESQDRYNYEIFKQAPQMMDVLQDISGFQGMGDYQYAFRRMIKRDGYQEIMKEAMQKAHVTYHDDNPLAQYDIPDEKLELYLDSIVYYIFDKLEDGYYNLLKEYNVNLDLEG